MDTGVLLAYVHASDPLHADALRIVADMLQGAHGQPYTSDYVLTEAFNFVRARVPRKQVAERLSTVAFGGPSTPALTPDILRVHGDVFAAAHRRYLDRWNAGLSLTDCTTLELIAQRGLDRIATFDGGFDPWAEVVR